MRSNARRAQIARANVNYILPASSAFSIWGVIYFFNALFVIYQAVPRINSDKVRTPVRPDPPLTTAELPVRFTHNVRADVNSG